MKPKQALQPLIRGHFQMKADFICVVSVFAAVSLSGCQTWEQTEAQREADLSRTLNAYRGETLAVFLQEQGAFRPVSAFDENGTRVFVAETEPTYVTLSAPAHTPAPGHFNDPSMAAGFANLNAALGTVPAVSQTFTNVCRLFIRATPTGGGTGPSRWQIQSITSQGHGC